MSEIESQLSERRSAWSEMTPAQQMARIQRATLDVVDLARWRKQQARRQLAVRLAEQPHKVKEYDSL